MIRASVALLLVLFSVSCATYNNRIDKYYAQVVNNEFDKAYSSLDNNKLLKRGRNRLLYLFEKGKMAHLLKQYDSSNLYFNEADLFIEDARTSARDVVVGNLLNPMMETYKGEDFEKFMVHYYKALNYLNLGQPNDAMVEARRISLRSYAQQDKTNNNNNRYSDDAFSLMMQGIIYEQNKDLNNAFISYRNAVDLFLKNKNQWYGVAMPEQLKKDLLRTAAANGFKDQVQYYEKQLNTSYSPTVKGEGGELVLFWENGLAPVKTEQNFYFALTKDGFGNFNFVDPTGNFSIPFDFSSNYSRDNLKLDELRSLRVAFPKYVEQPVFYTQASLKANNVDYGFERAENINELAFATLRERFVKEMVKTLTRLAIKKLAEAAARPKQDDKDKDKDKDKKTQEAIATAIQIFNFVSEKADTRNWQTLPHTIWYTRVPLQQGVNVLQLNVTGRGNATDKPINIVVEGKGGLQVQNVCTLR